MDAVRNALVTNGIDIFFHVIWFSCMAAEPKYGKKKTVFIFAATGVLFQVLEIGLSYTGVSGGRLSYGASYILGAVAFGAVYIFCVNMSLSKSVFLISAYYCLWTFIYHVTAVAANTFGGGQAKDPVIWLLRIGLNLLFLILCRICFKKRILFMRPDIESGERIIAALSFLAFYMATILVFMDQKQSHPGSFYLYLLISVYIFGVAAYAVWFRFTGRLGDVWELKQMQLRERLLMEQIASYEEGERNARQTRHDFRHHNIVVAEFARNRDYQGILDYLQIYEKEEEEKHNRTFCPNHAVDCALSAYVKKAKQRGIEVKTNIRFRDASGISDVDLVSILANIMENAINGCMQARGKRYLELFITQKGKKFVISCKNTCTSEILFENGIPKNKTRDSIGIESILRSVGKYSGDADFSAEDGIFTCRVVLCN